MAKTAEISREIKEEISGNGDWFAGVETTDNQIPRVSIGDPAKEKPDSATKILARLEGVYEGTTSEMIEGQQRLLHQILCREPVKGSPRVAMWGNAQVDNSIPCLEPGTKVSLSYLGEKSLSKGRRMKMINLTFPANAKKRPNPYAQHVDGDVPF